MVLLLFSLAWFFITIFCLGFALTREKNFMALGAGLCAFCILAVALNLAGIPLAWWVFLLLALAYPAYALARGDREILSMPKLEFRKEIYLILVVLIALVHLAIYYDGAFKYPYLEDDDSWWHAAGVKYIAQSQTASRPFDPGSFVRYYIEPYPPAYDMLMAMAYQLSDATAPTMIPILKTINVILISIALILAFYFVSAFTKSQELGLYATFILAALPSFMSHFIWSQTLAMAIAFVALYALAKIEEGKKYQYLFALATAALLVAQPSVAATMAAMLAIFAMAKAFYAPVLLKKIIAFGISGALLATLLYWGPIYLKYGEKTLDGIGLFSFQGTFIDKMSDTSGGVVYSLEDFLFPLPSSKMDQETGIGWVIAGLAIIGLLAYLWRINSHLGPEGAYLAVSAIWLIFTLLGTEGNALPIKLFPHRFWVFLSIPVAIFAAFAVQKILAKFKTREFRYGTAAILVAAIFATSASAKIAVQTSPWPPGVSFGSQDEVGAYVSEMAKLPKNTKVFPVCSSDNKLLAFDMQSEPFNLEYAAFKRDAWNKSWEEIHAFLKSRGYQYITLDTYCAVLHAPEDVNARLNSIPPNLFSVHSISPDPQKPALLIFKVE